jgi:type IV pilus assembly protein PilV
MIERGNYRAQGRASARARASGFTLLEVMVAVVVTAIGLLGIAKMQALAYASTGTASLRSLVAIQASGLAASMHANRTYWSGAATGGPPPTVITIQGINISDNGSNTLGSTATASNYCYSGGGGAPCATAVMAAFDLHTWALALNTMLNHLNPVTTISCPTINTPITCVIQVTWNERAVSINSQGATNTQVSNVATPGAAGTFAPTYMLYVEP